MYSSNSSKRSQSNSRKASENQDDKKLTLEDYLKKPDRSYEDLLPRETEERIISPSQSSRSDYEGDFKSSKDRRKKNMNLEEKLLVDSIQSGEKEDDYEKEPFEDVDVEEHEEDFVIEEIKESGAEEDDEEIQSRRSIKDDNEKLQESQNKIEITFEGRSIATYESPKEQRKNVKPVKKRQDSSKESREEPAPKIEIRAPPTKEKSNKTLNQPEHKPKVNQSKPTSRNVSASSSRSQLSIPGEMQKTPAKRTRVKESHYIPKAKSKHSGTQTELEPEVKLYAEKLQKFELILKTQTKELETIRRASAVKASEIQSLSAENQEKSLKINKLEKKITKMSSAIKKYSEESDSKNELIKALNEKINEFITKGGEINRRNTIHAEAEFWKTQDEKNNDDILRNKILWINNVHDKNLSEINERIRIKVNDSPSVRKNNETNKPYVIRNKHKLARRSLEPIPTLSPLKYN